MPALRKMVKRGKTPQARLHALWTLAGLNRLTDEDVLAGLKDQAAGVRENAVKLAELRRARCLIAPRRAEPARSTSDCVDALLKLASDSDARVRFQLAFTLGEITDPRAADALATIATRDAADPWIRTAVLSSVANTSDQLLARLLADAKFVASSDSTELIRELAQIVGVRGQTPEMQRVLKTGSREQESVRSRLGIGEGLKRSGKSLRRVEWDAETSDAD